MKTSIITCIGFLLICCSTAEQHKRENDIEAFNTFLGAEKANALNVAVESFEQFLQNNYADLDNQNTRVKAFLRQLLEHNQPDSLWQFETKKNLRIIELFETTGLRKDIWLYPNETYQPDYDIFELLQPEVQDKSVEHYKGELKLDLIDEEIVGTSSPDSAEMAKRDKEREESVSNSLDNNASGKYLYGLAKFAHDDSLIQEYIRVKATENLISPGVMAGGFLLACDNFDDPFLKRMLVVEFYYWIMMWDSERSW